ncbi:hypothetical protein [Gelatiniphilus marinus]|uniref:Uncharacterized protein n=1 Tax=Gelatiniphilus marinus TaxID=1759464 RepID=A0ABW5JQ72_9FLAO
MKRSLLVFAGLLIGLTSASATELNHQDQKTKLDKTKRYRYAQPIMFIERGVEFLVFPDGSFDFNTNFENRFNNDSYYKKRASKRRNTNNTYGAPGKRVKYSSKRYRNRGVLISHDRNGKVRRIGNLFLNYDRRGKLKRVGSIYINYKRNGTLTQVGGLKVKYNPWGEIVYTHGQVNRYSYSCNICGISACNTNHNHRDNDYGDDYDWYDDNVYDDDNHYYYKQNGKVKKNKKNKY